MPLCNSFTEEEKKLFSTMRVVVLSPVMYPEPKFIKCLADMIAYSWYQGLQIHQMGMAERMVVDWARNALARDALVFRSPLDNELFTHFLWLDSDIVFSVDLCCQLARHDVDAVSALYFARTGKPLPVAYVHMKDQKDPYKHNQLVEVPECLIEVDAFGFGACLIKREVFERTPEPWFTIDYRAGEDIAFCTKARQYGNKFYLDGAYSVGHIGMSPIIDKAVYETWYKTNGNIEKQKISLQGRI